MNSDNYFLFIWIKTHAYFYKLCEDNKITNIFLDNIHDDEFLCKFYTHHFKSSRKHYTAISTKFIMNNLIEQLDYFSFPRSITKDYVQNIFSHFKLKENKLSAWKIIFTLSFLEEYCFNKFIKIKDNLSISDLSVNIITNKHLELPELYSFKKLMKNPIFLKSILNIVNEVLSEFRVKNDSEFNNSILSYFYEDRSKTFNDYSIKHEIVDNGSDSYYECLTPQDNSKHEPKIFTFGGYDEDTASPKNKPQSSLNNIYNKSFTINDETYEEHASEPGINLFFTEQQRPHSPVHQRCFKCDEFINKIEEMASALNAFEANAQNLQSQLKSKEEEIVNLTNFNLLINKAKNNLEESLKGYQKKFHILTKANKEMEERSEELESLRSKLEYKNSLIDDLNDKLESFHSMKKLMEEYKLKLENMNEKNFPNNNTTNNNNTSNNKSVIENVQINNYNIFNNKDVSRESEYDINMKELERKVINYEEMIINLNKILRKKECTIVKLNEVTDRLKELTFRIKNKSNKFRRFLSYLSIFQASMCLIFLYNYFH
jgi:hypothetical protein